MWIRSQDRESLSEYKRFYYGRDKNHHIYTECSDIIGKYKLKERCLQVLDDLQDRIDNPLICYPDNSAKKRYKEVYQMPKE